MKKLLCIIFVSSMLFSEESGTFVGVGVGGAINASGYLKDGSQITNKFKGNGVNVEAIVGYKQFFIENLGLRYYLNVDYTTGINFKGERDIVLTPNNVIKSNKASMLDAGLNIDLLFNFIVTNNLDVGIYGGGQVGFNTISGDLAKLANDLYNKVTDRGGNYRVKAATLDFSASINFGIRTNFFKNHAIELFGKVPLRETNIFYYKDTITGGEDSIYMKQPYIVGLRYVFTF